jgi:trimethylamine--corrinoid protein Co-methyltransferase
MESASSALLGALAGINMISGAGMLDFLACHSIEKLVVDAEGIASAQRLLAGIEPRTEKLAVDMFAQIGLTGEFLKLKETRALFRKEQHFPSSVIDRGGNGQGLDLIARARQRVSELLASYQRPAMSPEVEQQLQTIARSAATAVGLHHLPGIEELDSVTSRI